MTRDELREKCIDAMEDGFRADGMVNNTIREGLIAAFDALHGLVRVVPPDATEEMMQAVHGQYWPGYVPLFCAMSAAGDLTKPLEKKNAG